VLAAVVTVLLALLSTIGKRDVRRSPTEPASWERPVRCPRLRL